MASVSFSVVPKRKGPWMRRMVTLEGMSLSCRMWALTVGEVLGRDGGDGGGFGDAVDVEERGERHADSDGDGEVGEHGEGEGGDPDGDVGLGEAEDGGDLAPLAHVVGDDEKHGGQSCQRNEAG